MSLEANVTADARGNGTLTAPAVGGEDGEDEDDDDDELSCIAALCSPEKN